VSVGAALTQEQVFDGDGQRTKLRSQQDTYHEDTYTWTSEIKTQYFVTSSVLGKVITELGQTGQKTRTFVYQGGEVLAWQQKIGTTENITWEHRDASNASVRFPGILEGEIGAELDPLGSAAPTHLPLIYPWQQEPSLSETRSYPALSDMLSGQCNLDGMPIPCSDLQDRMEMGIVATEYTGIIDSGPSGRKPPQRLIIPQGLGIFRINNAPYAVTGDDKTVFYRDMFFYSHSQGKSEPEECKNHRARLLGDSQNRAALRQAWADSLYGDKTFAHEEGGLLGHTSSISGNNSHVISRYSNGFQTLWGERSMISGFKDWVKDKIADWRGSVTIDYYFHTHPFDRGDKPSDIDQSNAVDPDVLSGITGDEGVAWELRPLTGVIVSPTKIIVYDFAGTIKCTFDNPF
jgi:hypothetical protein